MKKGIIIAMFASLCLQQGAQGQAIEALQKWESEGHTKIEELANQEFAKRPLSKNEAQKALAIIEQKWMKEAQQKYAQPLNDNVITHDNLTLKFTKRVLGEKPADGYSLYISMHGGGSAPSRVNDQQWANQIRLYTPSEGIYIAPRAPWDDWNMWFKPGLDKLFEKLIQCMVATMDVNPDKVYLLGYSAGGDGVWRMAPRMADSWAAASMMAGHPGEASQVNLRNTPFMIWMGERDSAFNRNKLAAHHGKIMDSLQMADKAGYIHETHIIEGKGHWMDRADTLAIGWMAQHRRNPYPNRVVWRQEEVTRRNFYWLGIPDSVERRHKMTVIAQYEGNTIDIEHCDYSALTLYLNDQMMNLDKPITVRYKGNKIFKGKAVRTSATMSQTLTARGDVRYIFPAKLEIELE